jgi:hypothetical protein
MAKTIKITDTKERHANKKHATNILPTFITKVVLDIITTILRKTNKQRLRFSWFEILVKDCCIIFFIFFIYSLFAIQATSSAGLQGYRAYRLQGCRAAGCRAAGCRAAGAIFLTKVGGVLGCIGCIGCMECIGCIGCMECIGHGVQRFYLLFFCL